MSTWIEKQLAERSKELKPSFIREILKTAASSDYLSFAGGLPNPELFPVEALKDCADKVFNTQGKKALQYTVTEGEPELRAWIAERYSRLWHISIDPEEILITNGSQQGLDLISKLLINEGDPVLVEQPSYLGAMQCFSQYRPQFIDVPLHHDGPDTEILEKQLETYQPKLMYAIPNFQNPSGSRYSAEKRHKVTELLRRNKTILIEDDPYGDLSFDGSQWLSMKALYPEGTFWLGSFSKIMAPGLRMGWIIADRLLIRKLAILKQASDLHTNHLTQQILCAYFEHYGLEQHLSNIRTSYALQCKNMTQAVKDFWPRSTTLHPPQGGMFLWIKLPFGLNSESLLKACVSDEKIVFVPGSAFYLHPEEGIDQLRLNYSNTPPYDIQRGMQAIGNQINILLEKTKAKV